MQWEYLIFISALFLITGLMVIFARLAWQRRRTAGGDIFIGLAIAATIWVFTSALEKLTASLATKILLSKIQYFGIASIAPLWLLFILDYTRQSHLLPRWGRIFLWVIPLISLGLVWTNEWHHLIWTEVVPTSSVPGAPTHYYHGWWFWVFTAYTYSLILTGSTLLIWWIWRSPRIYRRQAVTLLLGIAFPWVSNILYQLGYRPFAGYDITPVAFLLSTLILGFSIFQFRLLDLAPIARDAIVENMLDSVLVLDNEMRVADLNSRTEQLFSIEPDKCIGLPVRSFHPSLAILEDICSQDQPAIAEVELQEEKFYHLELRSTPLHDSRRRRIGSLILLRDITERKAQEETMMIQSVALEAAADGIVITHPDGAILWVNPAFTQITGYTADEVRGQNLRMLKSERQDEAFYRNLWNTILSGQVWRGEMVNRRKDGSLYDEEMTITPVIDRQGQINHFIAIKQDISKRKAAEEALRRSNTDKQRLTEAEAIAQERNRIAQEIHDGLAQNLAALRMRIGRWRRDLEKQPERVRSEIDEVEEMVNASLLEARRSIYALRPLALANQGFFAAIKQFIKGYRDYYQLNVSLDVRGPEECLPRHLELTLFRIIQEALNNTAKHASANNVWITLDLSGRKIIALTVRDDGQGFDLQNLGMAERKGHIGLQAMRERIQSAEGEMNVASRTGQGTVIYITFPIGER